MTRGFIGGALYPDARSGSWPQNRRGPGPRLVLSAQLGAAQPPGSVSTLGLIYLLKRQIDGLAEIVGDDGARLLELK